MDECVDITKIEKKICDFFGVSHEDLYSRDLKQDKANARHYLWFLLHCHYGISNLALARRYGRARITIIQYISQIKFRVEHQKEDIVTYEQIKKRGF